MEKTREQAAHLSAILEPEGGFRATASEKTYPYRPAVFRSDASSWRSRAFMVE